MLVRFQNLLEENTTDICYGVLNSDRTISCLCGCDGIFESHDYKVIQRYPNADISSIIEQYQKKQIQNRITNCPYSWKLVGCSINLQVFFYLNLTFISRRLDKLRIAVYNILIIRFIVSMFFEERRYVLLQRERTV